MSMPALRQPKLSKIASKSKSSVTTNNKNVIKLKPPKLLAPESQLIVTLKDKSKFVISSDSYHGILAAGEIYKCVFCETDIIRNSVAKEKHKNSDEHKKKMETYPHIERYAENLVRQPNKDNFYCTICNVLVSWTFISRHITSEVHLQELKRAGSRSDTYKEAC